jgi:hypothetical protein
MTKSGKRLHAMSIVGIVFLCSGITWIAVGRIAIGASMLAVGIVLAGARMAAARRSAAPADVP